MKTYIESITETVPIPVGEGRFFKVRVWRQEEKYNDLASHNSTAELVQQAIAAFDGAPITKQDLAIKILEQPRVNAVEVKGNDNNGICVYKDWP